MRQIVLDTETTGLSPKQGHRVIEIGAIELIDRRLTGEHFHQYLNPQCAVDPGALKIHGITNEFLADKPLFQAIGDKFFSFIQGAELVIHNAPFDLGFLNHEFRLLNSTIHQLEEHCDTVDTLVLARKLHPGQKNNLDALCRRYKVDNSKRDLHGALLDAQILAKVYLAMTGGQVAFFGGIEEEKSQLTKMVKKRSSTSRQKVTPVIHANREELKAHDDFLKLLVKAQVDDSYKG